MRLSGCATPPTFESTSERLEGHLFHSSKKVVLEALHYDTSLPVLDPFARSIHQTSSCPRHWTSCSTSCLATDSLHADLNPHERFLQLVRSYSGRTVLAPSRTCLGPRLKHRGQQLIGLFAYPSSGARFFSDGGSNGPAARSRDQSQGPWSTLQILQFRLHQESENSVLDRQASVVAHRVDCLFHRHAE